MSQETAWVLVDQDGKVLWGTTQSTKEQCLRLMGVGTPRDIWLSLEPQGYTFERVEVIPEGCKVCEWDHPKGWRPI